MPDGGLTGQRRAARWACALVSVATAVAFTRPVFEEIHNWGIQDWDQHLFHHAVARASVVEYGQFPLWNPYNWSGVPLFASPESRILTPTFPLHLAFGELVGLKLEILLYLLFGMLGAQWLLREFEVGWVASLLGSCVFAFNSWYAVHITVGHSWALNVAYLPWVVLCFRRAQADGIQLIPLAALLALCFLGGGVYLLVIALLLLGLLAAFGVLIAGESPRRHAAVLLSAAALALLLGAVKFLPAAELMLRYPRLTPVEGGYTLSELVNALVDRAQALGPALAKRSEDFNGSPVHEGLYVGVLPLLLFAIGALSGGRRTAVLVATTLVLLWVSLGTQVEPSAWAWLHALPVFDNLRLPQRFGIGAVLLVAVVAGMGLDAVRAFLARRTGAPGLARGAAVCIALFVLADLFAVSSRVFEDAFPIPPRESRRSQAFEQHLGRKGYSAPGPVRRIRSSLSDLYGSFLANHGSTWGYEIVPAATSAIPVGDAAYRGELFLADGSGSASFRSWSPNRLDVALHPLANDRLVVNQNFDPGWRVVGGRGPVEDWHGLLSVRVAPQDAGITLRYLPRSFLVGAGISATSSLVLAALAWRARGRGPASADRTAAGA